MKSTSRKYGRRLAEISEEKHSTIKRWALEKGLKFYVALDDVLEAGMKRKRLVPEGTSDGEGGIEASVES